MFALILTFACAGCGPTGALSIGPVTTLECQAIIADMRNVDATDRNAPAFMACVSTELAAASLNGNGCTPLRTDYFTAGVHQRTWWCKGHPGP